MFHFLVVAIALLALAIVVLGYVWILAPRKRPATPAGGTFFEVPNHPWTVGKDHRRDIR